MDAKEIGLLVKEFAEKLVEDNVKLTTLDMDDNTRFVDWLGSALIMQGTMLMLEAGCPSDIVLTRAISCVKSWEKDHAVETLAEESQNRIILPGGKGN